MRGTVVVSQLGARMHYAVPRIFEGQGELERLYTDISGVRGWGKALRMLPPSMLPAPVRRLVGRIPHGIPPEKIHTFESFGMISGFHRTFSSPSAATRTTLLTARGFSRAVVRRGFGAAAGFYGVSGECLEQLEAARDRGLWTAVEQIVAAKEVLDRLVAHEHQRHPGWGSAFAGDPWAQEYAAREKAEWSAADIVICPSEFVRHSIAQTGGPVERCVVVPYGVDTGFRVERPPRPRDEMLRVLVVGQVGLRKGAPYVLEAATRLAGKATFRMVGPIAVNAARRRQIGEKLDLVGPTPRSQIMAHFRWADIFFLPSVCEGSATVTYEALAAGLPVVTTPNAGSVVRDDVEGFICAAGDTDAFCDRLARFAKDRALLATMSRQAVARAGHYDIASYGTRLLEALRPLRARAAGPHGRATRELVAIPGS